ncbi:MAG: alkaline phosphatase [Armatimonadota bacterium]
MKLHRTVLRGTAIAGGVVALIILTILAGRAPVGGDVPVAADATPDNVPAARNVVIMISDGCGFNHLQAAAIYQHGTPTSPLYESFPVRLAMTTFAAGGSYEPERAAADFAYVKEGATDSAAAATALACGVKTYAGAIGVGEDKQPLRNVVEHAEALGKATGVVTSVQLSHATPAGFVAHNESRNNYVEIASEMINESAVDVIMGAGHPEYDDNARPRDGEREYRYVGGEETWRALRAGTAGADADGDGDPDPWTLIESLEQFRALQQGDAPPRAIGVPRVATTLQQKRAGDPMATAFEVPFNDGVPTLPEMTLGALNVLHADPDGFLVMVEGGAVDWASHANQPGRLIEEQIDFDRAVAAVVEWVEANSSWDETLLVVTADHECGYLTGPDADPTALVSRGAGVMPQMEFHSGSHTNSLVPLFARGPGAEALQSVADGSDPVRGAYLDNTQVARLVFAALR